MEEMVFRKFIIIIVFFIAVCLLAVGCLIYFVDPNRLKPAIVKQISIKTGYQARIEGKLTWCFSPHFGVYIPQLKLKKPNAATSFAEFRDIIVETRISNFFLKHKNIRSHVSVSHLHILNLEMEKLRCVMRFKKRYLKLQSLHALLYGGNFLGEFKLKDWLDDPKWTTDFSLNDIELQPFFNAIQNDLPCNDCKDHSRIKIYGRAHINAAVTSVGKTFAEIIQHLQGNANITVQEGTIDGINLNYYVEVANAFIHKLPLPNDSDVKYTGFHDLTTTIAIRDGMLVMNDLLLLSNVLKTTAAGNYNLLDQTMNLKLKIAPPRYYQKWHIPISIEGNLQEPRVILNLNQLEKVLFRTELEAAKAKIKEEIPELAKDFLKYVNYA